MSTKVTKTLFLVLFFAGVFLAVRTAQAQNPTPTPLDMPGYNYTESNSCTRCHFVYGVRGDHMLEAVGVAFDTAANAFKFSGNGWRASRHSQSNFRSTQNTYCAKCHSPLQAKAESTWNDGFFENTSSIPSGQMEGVTCAACHPSHNSAVVLGRRLGIYQWGKDKTTPEAYQVVHEGEEDALCLNCHVERHNETNAAFVRMYNAGVRCIDCHMAEYGLTNNGQGTVQKMFHDFRVATNLPFSCGARGSITNCHLGFSANATLAFLPYLKEQHTGWWPIQTAATKTGQATRGAKERTADDYLKLWQYFESLNKE